MLISERSKDGVGKTGMLEQFIKSANGVVYHFWHVAKKIKLLLPAGWVFFGGRRLIRELMGKRKKTDIKKLVDGAGERRDLYSQLHLYEAEG